MASLTSLTAPLTESLTSNTGLLLLGSSLIILLYFWINSGPNEHELFAKRNVKHHPFGNVLISMLKKTRFELQRHEIFKKEGGLIGAIQMGKPTIFMTNPDLAQQVLSKNFTSFTNRRTIKMTDSFFSNALFMIEDEKWKRCRSIMTPTFAMGKIKMMKPILDDTAKTLVHNFNNALDATNGKAVELKNICGAFTMDTVVQIAFGVKIDSLVDKENPLLKHARKIFQQDLSLYNLGVLVITYFTPSIARFFKLRMNGDALDFFDSLADDIINNKRQAIKNSNNNVNNNGPEQTRATNFIELLLEAENERLKLEANVQDFGPGSKAVKYMTNDEIVAQCVMLLMVGYDTTATAITMTLYNLTLNPEIQERLYEEIMSTLKELQLEGEQNSEGKDVISDPIKLFTMEKIKKMKYLESVIKETLRVYPPGTFTERVASEDVTLENGNQPIYVKKGDVINIPLYTMHRDTNYWNDPESFNPDRFMDPNPTYHKYSYIPFGAGPRNCIAQELAYTEIKVAILHAVRLFKFKRSDKTPVPVQFYYQTNLLINKDIHVDVERRN